MKRPLTKFVTSAGYDILTRIVLTTVFWAAAVGNTLNFPEFLSTLEALRVPLPNFTAVAVLMLLTVGTLLIVANKHVTLAAFGLAAFTLLTIPLAHPFWNLSGAERLAEMRIALEHVSLVGGLMAIASLSLCRIRTERQSSADLQTSGN